jgi:phenylpropionate dioxygenase-like ring-hydroxylating dioxygenase large terminal subunit
MSVDYINRALERVGYPVSSSWSLPPGCYHDPGWFEREMESVFAHGWLGIGRTDQWQQPGDFETVNLGNISIVVVMDEDRTLNGMSNTCLHRSSQITSGSGHCKALVCPFHGWSYDYRGRVISAPRMEDAQDFSIDDLRLRQFTVEQQDGFVFVSLKDNPGPLEHWLGDFPDLHQPWALSDLVTGRRRSFDVECNWKLFIEVFNEYYHLPYVHPDSISGHYPEPDGADDVIGEYTSQFGTTVKNPALLEDDQDQSFPVIKSLDERLRTGARYTWVYPNMSFAAGADCMWMYHVYPISSASTRVVQTICFPSDTTGRPDFPEKAETYYRRFDFAMDEDIPTLVKQQAGMQSPYAVQGRFSSLEPSVGNFACWYAEAMVAKG